MKALTLSLSTKLSHESCWGCSGSEGSVSGWEDKDSISHGVPCAGGLSDVFTAPQHGTEHS